MAKKLRAVLVAGLLGLMGRPLAQASLTDGLVAYWPFDEGSGTTALDAVGSNDGTINGGAVYAGGVGIAPVPGNVDALTFDGVDDFVTVPHAAVLDVTTTYTISVWLNMAFVAGYQPMLFRGDSTADDIELYWYPGQALTVVHNRRSDGSYDGAIYFVDPPTGTLFHLAVVFDGNIVKAYYNGVPAAPSGTGCCGFDHPLPAPLATNKGWWIGLADNLGYKRAGGSVPGFFKGLMDEVRIYNRALNESEIAELADVTPPPDCEVDLAQCEADLTECLTNPVIPDQDGDGEPDATDACSNTSEGVAVDQAGCSLEQFCTAIETTTAQGAKVCEKSDWRNDEPLMKAKEADCEVEKNGPGREDDRCVPQL